MLQKFLYFFLLFSLFLSSCFTDSRYKGYTHTDSGLYYKLQYIGEGKNRPKAGDYLQLIITYKNEKDSVFLDTYSSNETGKVILPFLHSSFSGSFEEGLTYMNEGDSASFIVSADSLFRKFFKKELPLFLQEGSNVKMEVKLNRIFNKKEYEEELAAFEQIISDRDIEEQRKLKLFLDTCRTQYYPLENGMFYLPVKQGRGSMAERGDLVRIQYKGYFLNGKQFETSYDRPEAFEFTFGQDDQVIKGFETAISLMNEGSKTKFIIPSRLAFGEMGSSSYTIPPYSTVIYEIELINLTKK